MLLKHPLPVIHTGNLFLFIRKGIYLIFIPSIQVDSSFGGCVDHDEGLPCPEKKINPHPLLIALTVSHGFFSVPSDVYNFMGLNPGILSNAL